MFSECLVKKRRQKERKVVLFQGSIPSQAPWTSIIETGDTFPEIGSFPPPLAFLCSSPVSTGSKYTAQMPNHNLSITMKPGCRKGWKGSRTEGSRRIAMGSQLRTGRGSLRANGYHQGVILSLGIPGEQFPLDYAVE